MNLFVLAKYQYRKNLQKWKKGYRQRLQILSQLLTSQDQYCKMLTFLTCECKSIMVQELRIDTEQFDKIFGCVQSIRTLHQQFHRELTTRLEMRTKPGFRFGDLLCKYFPYFKVYETYMRTLGARKNALIEINTQGRLVRFKEALERKSGSFTEKFGSKMIRFMASIEVIDYINSPFQRIYKYEMFLTRYLKLLKKDNPDLPLIRQSMQLLKSILNQFNQDVGKSKITKCMQLEKRFGSIAMPQRKFQGEFYGSYWAGTRNNNNNPRCYIYIMNDLLLIVDDSNGRVVNRIQMDSSSWYHKFSAGKNIANAIMVKGIDSYQILFLPTYTLEDFLKILKGMFGELLTRQSLQNSAPSLAIIPTSVSRMERQCIFTLYIKVHGARGATYNSYTLPELEKAMAHLTSKYPNKFKPFSDFLSVNTSQPTLQSDFDAQYTSLCLFPYLAPLMCDFSLTQSDYQFQYLFSIRDYLAVSQGQLLQQTITQPLAKDMLRLEKRTRTQPISYSQKVEVNFVTESGEKRKLRIGKEERAYSVVRRIIPQGFNLDFAIFVDSQKSSMRILDDDDVVYAVMKREGHVFKQQSNLLMTSLRKIDNYLGAKQTTVYFRKYLYLESSYPQMLQKVDQQRLQFMTDNILHIMFEQRMRLTIDKVSDMLALVMKLKQYGMIATQQQQLIESFWLAKVQDSEPETLFRDRVFTEYAKLTKVNLIECFVRLFSAVEFWPQYAFVVDCCIEGSRGKLIIRHRVLQVRESVESQTPLLRVQLNELEYETTPSYLVLKLDEQMVKLEVEWVYGVVLVIERNRGVHRIKTGQARFSTVF